MCTWTHTTCRSITIYCILPKSASSPVLIAAVCAGAEGTPTPDIGELWKNLLCYVQMQLSMTSPPALSVALSGRTPACIMSPSTVRRQLMRVGDPCPAAYGGLQLSVCSRFIAGYSGLLQCQTSRQSFCTILRRYVMQQQDPWRGTSSRASRRLQSSMLPYEVDNPARSAVLALTKGAESLKSLQ